MNIVTLNDSPEMIAKAMGLTPQATEEVLWSSIA